MILSYLLFCSNLQSSKILNLEKIIKIEKFIKFFKILIYSFWKSRGPSFNFLVMNFNLTCLVEVILISLKFIW